MKFDLERILLRTPFVKNILAEKNQKISHFAKEYSKRRAVDLIFKPENEINKVEENILRGYYSAVGCDGARYFRISYEKGIPEVGRVIGIDKMHDSENIFEDTYPSRITEKDKLSGRILPYVVLNKKIYHLDLRSSNFKDHLYCFPLDESNSLIKNNAGEIERFEEKIGEPIIQKILANSNHSGVKEKYELPLIEEFEHFDGEKHRRCMGVLVSDNTFSDHSIDAHRLETMIFTSQTAATRLSGARLMDKYKSEASFDYLTGFYKKKPFEEEMAKRIHSALRYGHIFSVAMLDIDYFKPINDTYGHLAGDGILKTVSSLIIFSTIFVESSVTIIFGV